MCVELLKPLLLWDELLLRRILDLYIKQQQNLINFWRKRQANCAVSQRLFSLMPRVDICVCII